MKSEQQLMLIVDDADSCVALKDIFQADFTVIEAQNDKKAMQILAQYGEKINVVVIDVEQPATAGFSLLQQMKQTPALAAIPVVVHVEHVATDNELAAMRLGVSDFISKPYHTEIVHERVQNVVNRRAIEQLRMHAERDELTGIYNRTMFVRSTQDMLANHKDTRYVLLRWDIERFKVVNELFGTEMGDTVLCTFAHCLQKKCTWYRYICPFGCR